MDQDQMLRLTEKAREKAKTLSGRSQSELKNAANELFGAWLRQNQADYENALQDLEDLFAYYGI